MTKVYAPHLVIIHEALTAIEGYRPTDLEAFLADTMVQDAVLMRLQVIGEQLARMRRLDEDRFAAVAQASWYQIIGLRNVISHGYEAVDRRKIWGIIADDLPDFVSSLRTIEPE